MSTVKEELTRLIQVQPDDSSREEIVRDSMAGTSKSLASFNAYRVHCMRSLPHKPRSKGSRSTRSLFRLSLKVLGVVNRAVVA